jgi:hypothetical protein
LHSSNSLKGLQITPRLILYNGFLRRKIFDDFSAFLPKILFGNFVKNIRHGNMYYGGGIKLPTVNLLLQALFAEIESQ